MIIDKGFLKLDIGFLGVIDSDDIRENYDITKHPKARGNPSEDEVINDFLESFGNVKNQLKISRAEWNDYYAAVSSNIDNDEHFILLMKMAWKLTK